MKNMKHFFVSKLLMWLQIWIAGVRHGNSLVDRRVSPGRKIVVLGWTKYAISRQIKPGILKLTIGRGKNNYNKFFIFVSCHYLVVSVGQVSFERRSDCGLRMQPSYARLSLKWYYDQKKKFFFSLDFKTTLTKH